MISVKNNLTGKLNTTINLKGKLATTIKEITPAIEDLEVTPTKEQQVFNHENSYGYDEVIVEPIPDEYIIPDGTLPITENATYDVRSYARVSASVYPAPNLQDKELTINENGTHDITADEGYDGLNQVSVTVDAIENLEEELETYNTELTEQETTINDIVETLKTKAIPSGGEEEMVRYSAEERVIGTWIDGKPVYRKTVSYFMDENVDVTSFLAGISNMKFLVKASGVGAMPGNMIFIPLNYIKGPNWDSFHVVITEEDATIWVQRGENYQLNQIYITLEYTKTTD